MFHLLVYTTHGRVKSKRIGWMDGALLRCCTKLILSQKVFLACTAGIERLDFTSHFECGWQYLSSSSLSLSPKSPNVQTYTMPLLFLQGQTDKRCPSYRNIRKVFFARQAGHNVFLSKKDVSRCAPRKIIHQMPVSQPPKGLNLSIAERALGTPTPIFLNIFQTL